MLYSSLHTEVPQPNHAPQPLYLEDIPSFPTSPCDALSEDIHRAANELRPELDNFWCTVNTVDVKMRRWHSDPLFSTCGDTTRTSLHRLESEPCMTEPYMTDCGKPCSRIEPADKKAETYGWD